MRIPFLLIAAMLLGVMPPRVAPAEEDADAKVRQVVDQGLEWLASQQSARGRWAGAGGKYPTAMTGMAGVAILCEGSTTTQGRYSDNVRRAVDYLTANTNPSGLIGDPKTEDRYTYGHGFGMLFLSQVLGEEEDLARRRELVGILTRAVQYTGRAQTQAGGWGYVSAEDGSDFDEGSTTITQVQALRGCRNAGIPVPKSIIDRAITYIQKCTTEDGGVEYNIHGGGSRPAITAAAVACLFNAGEYDSEYVPRLLKYCDKNLNDLSQQGFGHWHYAHYYYSQVQYRKGGESWEKYRAGAYKRLLSEVAADGSWHQGYIGAVYTTSINLTILQLEGASLPIYQR